MKKIKNSKKGAILMQVLLVAVIIATMATMILRLNLSRTATTRKMLDQAVAMQAIEGCIAEIERLVTTNGNINNVVTSTSPHNCAPVLTVNGRNVLVTVTRTNTTVPAQLRYTINTDDLSLLQAN